MSNRITLAQLCKMDANDVASIPTIGLAQLQEDLAELQAKAKAHADKLAAEFDRRFSAAATAARRAEDKDSGTVRLTIDGVEIKADLTKKVTWNQSQLRNAVETVKSWGENPDEYVKTELSVAEKTYGAWPSSIKAVFQPARTTGVGSPKYTLSVLENA